MAKETPIGEVMLTGVRLSFADLYKPGKPMKNDDGVEVRKYRASFLLKKNDGNWKKILKAADQAKTKLWGEDPDKWPKIKADRSCLRDGNEEDWDGYQGMWYLSASNLDQPVLISRHKDDKGKWIPAKDGLLYSGCYVNALVRIWAQDHQKYGKRINASLEVVQFDKKGEAFGGGGPIDVEDKFSAIEADEGFAMGEDDEDEDDVSGLI